MISKCNRTARMWGNASTKKGHFICRKKESRSDVAISEHICCDGAPGLPVHPYTHASV
jgi:hypothetical protein